jgi:hypothetical protein
VTTQAASGPRAGGNSSTPHSSAADPRSGAAIPRRDSAFPPRNASSLGRKAVSPQRNASSPRSNLAAPHRTGRSPSRDASFPGRHTTAPGRNAANVPRTAAFPAGIMTLRRGAAVIPPGVLTRDRQAVACLRRVSANCRSDIAARCAGVGLPGRDIVFSSPWNKPRHLPEIGGALRTSEFAENHR